MYQDGTVILWYSIPSIDTGKTNEIRKDYVFQKIKEKAMQMQSHTFGERVHKCKTKKKKPSEKHITH